MCIYCLCHFTPNQGRTCSALFSGNLSFKTQCFYLIQSTSNCLMWSLYLVLFHLAPQNTPPP
jgi:hypothetical protein